MKLQNIKLIRKKKTMVPPKNDQYCSIFTFRKMKDHFPDKKTFPEARDMIVVIWGGGLCK